MKNKYFKYIVWLGKIEKIPCNDHSYSWSGNMPCTGIERCIHCGKPKS